ncbi:MAG: hypothetical protein DME76_11570 [Verrucomicrobia bacterium]|nr:MAG: hypothetical protein DME76_11570 [Verrucomicrobiota bacterium]
MLLHFHADRLGQRVQRGDLIQRRFVKHAAHQPAFLPITVEVALAQVFEPDQAFVRIVKINLRHANSVLPEKVRDGHVMPVFFPLQIVFDQDQRLLC